MCVVICEYYALLYKELGHLWILVSSQGRGWGGPGTNALQIPRGYCI